MDKYYTPELNEFCLDFEYEEKLNGVYEKKVFDGYTALIKKSFYGDYGDWYDSIEEDIESDRIRVKYLDKEDIENLGFKKRTISRSEWSKIINDQIFTIHEFWTYNQSERENLIRITSGKENNFPYRIKFEGDIKNKSELTKLLKQLQIG